MQYAVIPTQLGAQLKALRLAQQVSVAEVADYMQISSSRVWGIERNPLAIKLHQFYLLMTALGAEVHPFPDLETLRPMLIEARRSTGLTQARFGQMVGVTQSRIAHIESDPAHISMDLFLKVLASLRMRLFIGQHVYREPAAALRNRVGANAEPALLADQPTVTSALQPVALALPAAGLFLQAPLN
ncbi:helix-turn-helix transcriptional regulator [Curvibacter gracilis]|uniref:helix-turn-helix transcriptional regulator n=1 Tax=Curvibacter gracilis TaxID=230310 RepID=UPI0004BA3EDD|nr:helix-turn-helix transcriptional regulator [Curvibacter gracilis]